MPSKRQRQAPPRGEDVGSRLAATLIKKDSAKLREWCARFNIKTGNTSRETLAAGVTGWVLEREIKNEQEVLAQFLRTLRQRKPSGRGR